MKPIEANGITTSRLGAGFKVCKDKLSFAEVCLLYGIIRDALGDGGGWGLAASDVGDLCTCLSGIIGGKCEEIIKGIDRMDHSGSDTANAVADKDAHRREIAEKGAVIAGLKRQIGLLEQELDAKKRHIKGLVMEVKAKNDCLGRARMECVCLRKRIGLVCDSVDDTDAEASATEKLMKIRMVLDEPVADMIKGAYARAADEETSENRRCER